MDIIAKVFRGKIPSSRQGTYAFRGQADATWELCSSARRRLKRLINEGHTQTNGSEQTSNEKLYQSYHKDKLIDPARTAGFDIEEGREISDLQLLTKLQHFGAATGLIDFTWNPLIALWFACEEHLEKDGKIFVVNLNDARRYIGVSDRKETIDKLFPPYDDRSLYWEPEVRSEAAARILVQHSVFVLARSHVLNEVEDAIPVEASDKNEILEELADLGITRLSLFRDIHGFSKVNEQGAPVSKMRL